MFTESLTWKCQFCGDTRPDAQISVVTKDDPRFLSMKYNKRHCRDRAKCIADASEWLTTEGF